MRRFGWILFLAGFSVFGQVEYDFDYVVVHENYGVEGAPSSKLNNGFSYIFINSKKEGYYLKIYSADDKGNCYLTFNDLGNKINGSGVISQKSFSQVKTIMDHSQKLCVN